MSGRSEVPRSRPRFGAARAPIAEFKQGLATPVHALRYVVSHPSTWKFCLLSGLLTVGVFALLAVVGVAFTDDIMLLIWAKPEAAVMVALWWLAAVLTGVLTVIVALGVSLVLANVILGPFMDALSERVEVAILDNAVETRTTIGSLVREAGTGIAHPLLTLALYLALMVPVFALNVVPLAGSLASAALGFALSASMMAFEFTDQPQSRRRFTWKEKVALLRAERWSYLGLGVGLGLLLFVPVLSFFLVPVAVVAGTMLFCGLDEAMRVPFADRRQTPSPKE